MNSTLGVTFLTLGAISLVVGFLIFSTHPASVPMNLDDEEELNVVDNTPQSAKPTAPAAVKPLDPYASNRAKKPTAPKYVARLTRTSDCRWASDSEAPRDGAPLRVGQTLRMTTGLAEIAFACGAKAILEGPAVLEVQSEKSGALRTGRMTANVPDEVEGFTVHTPVAQVVSLCAVKATHVARLTSIADCVWDKDSAAVKKGDALKSGQKVKLTEGLAEITFACGAKVILQGPGVLEIETIKTAILHSGKLTADVPDDLEGFKIRTPVVEVIALPAEPKATKDKTTTANKATTTKSDSEPGVVILKAGEHAQINVPSKETKEAASKKPQSSGKTPAKS